MNYELIRSSRKTIAIQIRKDASVVVRAPQHTPKQEIDWFVADHADWIQKHTEAVKKRMLEEEPSNALSMDQIRELANKALIVIPPRTAHYAAIMGVSYGRITIRNQKTRWGSCSAKGNLNFNCLLMLMPEEILDYVIVHELAHLREMNHSPQFWAIVEEVLPDYQERKQWLKENGGKYMRMQG